MYFWRVLLLVNIGFFGNEIVRFDSIFNNKYMYSKMDIMVRLF